MPRRTPDIVEISDALRAWMESHNMRSWQDSMRFVKARGLSVPQFGALMLLSHHEGCGVSEIADDMDITSPAASQLLERLVQQGLVERREDPRDRRARTLSLTASGRSLIAQSAVERFRWVEEMVAALKPQTRRALAEVLPALLESTQSIGRDRGPARRRSFRHVDAR